MAAQPWRWFIKGLYHLFNDTTLDLEKDNHFLYAFLARNLADALTNNRRRSHLHYIYSNEGSYARECSDLVIEAYVTAMESESEYQANPNIEYKHNVGNITKKILTILQAKKPEMLRKKMHPNTITINDSIEVPTEDPIKNPIRNSITNYVQEQAIWWSIMQQPDAQNAFNNLCINPTEWKHVDTLVRETYKIRIKHDSTTQLDWEKIIEIFDYFQNKAAFEISHPGSNYFSPYYSPYSSCASSLNQKDQVNVSEHPYIRWRLGTSYLHKKNEKSPRENKQEYLTPSSARLYNQAQLAVIIDKSPSKSPRGGDRDSLKPPLSARSNNIEAQLTNTFTDEKTLNPTKKMTAEELTELQSKPCPQRYQTPTFRNVIGFYALHPIFWVHAIMDAVIRIIFKIVNCLAGSYKKSPPVVFIKAILALILFSPYLVVHLLAKITTPNGMISMGQEIKEVFCVNSSEVSHIKKKIEMSSIKDSATHRSSNLNASPQITLTKSSTYSQPTDLHLNSLDQNTLTLNPAIITGSELFTPAPSPDLNRRETKSTTSTFYSSESNISAVKPINFSPTSQLSERNQRRYRLPTLSSPSINHNSSRLFQAQQTPHSLASSLELNARTNNPPTHVIIKFDEAGTELKETKPTTPIPSFDYPEPSRSETTPVTHTPINFYPPKPQAILYDEPAPQTDTSSLEHPLSIGVTRNL